MSVTVYPTITDAEVLDKTKEEILRTNSLIKSQNNLIKITNEHLHIITEESVGDTDN